MKSHLLALALCCAAHPGMTLAQTWPDKPIRLVVAGAAGTGMDMLGRAMSESLREQLGQPVVVDPKPGANQMIAAEACANARPDGYTFCITAPEPYANNLLLFKKLPYDAVNGFAPVGQLTTHSAAILVSSGVGATTLPEIAARSRAHPRTLNWASFGENSISHIYLEGIREKTSWDVTHIPYKSTTDVKQAMMVNDAQVTYLLLDGVARDQIEAGKLVPVAFAGKRRSPLYPKVPTFEEAGLKDFYIEGWYGLLAPAGTPDAIVQRMNRAAMKAMSTSAVTAVLPIIGNAKADENTPAQFATVIRESREVVRSAVKNLKFQPQ